MKKTPEKPSAQIIKGPWKKRSQVKKASPEEQRLREEVEFAEDLISQITNDIVYSLNDNGYDVNANDSICDMAFVIEAVRTLIYREIGLKHPLSGVMTELIVGEVDESNRVSTRLDVDKTVALVKFLKDDDEPQDPKVS